MKKLFLSLIMLAMLGLSVNAQTYVSGGIYSNTTWTLAGSPYIVTDTVVVFPSVTLTIQPGVIVKFDSLVQLELRQASLIAQGTSADSITFTSNSATPYAGIYSGIYVNSGSLPSTFKFCNFLYADISINYLSNGILTVKNCNFKNNNNGISAYSVSGSQIANVDTSNFINTKDYGMDFNYSDGNVIVNDCNFLNNWMGFAGIEGSGIIRQCNFKYNYYAFEAWHLLLENCKMSQNDIGGGGSGEVIIKNCIIDSNSIWGYLGTGDSIINCHVFNNGYGIESGISVIKNNIIDHNEYGIYDYTGYGVTTITGNNISYNNIGIDTISERFIITNNIIENNSIGLILNNATSTITCNKICNSSTYDLKYLATFNTSLPNNYWCTTDSASTEALIYDGYDDYHYGLVSFMPLDTVMCYLSGGCSSFFYLYPDSTTPHYYWAINLSSGYPPLHYLWSWGDGATDTIAFPSHIYSSAGFYNICLQITDSTGCTHTYCDSTYLSKHLSTMIYINVVPSIVTGITSNHNNFNITLYPNPTTDNLTIDISTTLNIPATIEITNLQGQVIEQQTTNVETTNLDVSALARGMYFVKVKTENGVAVKKFIKE